MSATGGFELISQCKHLHLLPSPGVSHSNTKSCWIHLNENPQTHLTLLLCAVRPRPKVDDRVLHDAEQVTLTEMPLALFFCVYPLGIKAITVGNQLIVQAPLCDQQSRGDRYFVGLECRFSPVKR
jgi:hypothetical protein